MRTVALLSVALLLVTAGCAGVGTNGPGSPATESTTTAIEPTTDDGTARPTAKPVESTATTETDRDADASGSLDSARTEQLVHRYVNAERSDQGRSNLSFDPALAEIARYHSRDMARNDYFSHTGPDGETLSDRYDRFDYDCRVSTGSNTYVTGGENIGTIQFSGMEFTEREIARRIVDGWMESPGHRENLLRPYWESEGIGVVVERDEGRIGVYVTQNFC